MLATKKTTSLTLILWFVIAVGGRIIPHWPNATPLTALCLFAPVFFGKRRAILFSIITLLASDFILSTIINHYPLFGSWSVFTYSGFLIVTLLGYMIDDHRALLKNFSLGLLAVLFYWLWTNFGVWLLSRMYAHSVDGLIQCFVLALPFLKYALIGTTIWIGVLSFAHTALEKAANARWLSAKLH